MEAPEGNDGGPNGPNGLLKASTGPLMVYNGAPAGPQTGPIGAFLLALLVSR
jgi:hypothetical protein